MNNISNMLEIYAKLELGEITFDEIRELKEQEEQVTKLQIVGYDREEAAKLLKKYSFDYLYNKKVEVKSDLSLSEVLDKREREYQRIMSRRKLFANM